MATSIFGATGVNGGTSGTMDSIKYDQLTDGDICFITVNSGEEFYVYTYDAGNVAAESSPDIVYVDDAGANGVTGTEAWLLCDHTIAIATVRESLSVGTTSEFTGNVNFAANVDIDGNLTFDGGAVTIDTILDEDDLTSDDENALATQQSIKAYVDNVGGVSPDLFAGWCQRTTFGYTDADTITLSPARYHHNGTTEQIVKWDAALTFDFESGGSNAGSSDFGTSEWHYLYIDDSALSGATITAARLLNSTTAPTWSATELGWYNSNDRCIGAFYVDSAGDLEDFHHVNNRIVWENDQTIFSSLTSSYAAKTFLAPAFAIDQQVGCLVRCGNNSAVIYWQHTDAGGDHFISQNRYDVENDNQARSWNAVHLEVVIDSSQQANFKSDGSDTVYCYQDSYYLPIGM